MPISFLGAVGSSSGVPGLAVAKQRKGWAARAEYAIAATLLKALRLLPRRTSFAVARMCTGLLARAVPKLTRVAHTNLSFALPDLSASERDAVVKGVFDSIARLLVAFAKMPDIDRGSVSSWIRYEGLEYYREAKARGRGILVATAHLGNWELSAFAHALMTEPMGVMVRPLDNPLVDRIVEERRQLSGNKLIVKKESALAVVRALKQNQAVGILIDQNTTPDEGVFVDFFGKKACAGVAFARLAARTGAAVIPGFAFWEKAEQKYVLRFYPPVEMKGDAQADTQRIHSVFEQLVRQYPDQWLWIHRRWKTRPPGEAPLY
jgi:KDO2-lipid IV(A) lauroyltransferase